MSENDSRLMAAVDQVCGALQAHARVALAGADVLSIIQAGNALRSAVLKYEQVLRETTRWSNPIRHLGRLPMYYSGEEHRSGEDGDAVGERFRVAAEYVVEVVDEELLANFAESRGDDRPSDAREAIRFLFESDSWDVWQYPPDRLRLVDVDVTLTDLS